MNINGKHFRSIWIEKDEPVIYAIDQRELPFSFRIQKMTTVTEIASSISTMVVRGAPLIGATAACGMYIAASYDSSSMYLKQSAEILLSTRPTAINLRWAIDKILIKLLEIEPNMRAKTARIEAEQFCNDDIEVNSNIGNHGYAILRDVYSKKRKSGALNILTHCNAGWLATVDWGTALAPIYKAQREDLNLHIWIDETRPRNQGSSLTAWELKNQDIPYTIISDNAGGHLMQNDQIDLCIVGSDRTARTGAVCNKIGTYLKALAAKDNNVPFYVALPSSTIDWSWDHRKNNIVIEERNPEEVLFVKGALSNGTIAQVRTTPYGSTAANPAFDITPPELISGLITNRGICKADENSLLDLHPENDRLNL